MNWIKFKIVERMSEECIYFSGIIYSLGLSCKNIERMARVYGLIENGPNYIVFEY